MNLWPVSLALKHFMLLYVAPPHMCEKRKRETGYLFIYDSLITFVSGQVFTVEADEPNILNECFPYFFFPSFFSTLKKWQYFFFLSFLTPLKKTTKLCIFLPSSFSKYNYLQRLSFVASFVTFHSDSYCLAVNISSTGFSGKKPQMVIETLIENETHGGGKF